MPDIAWTIHVAAVTAVTAVVATTATKAHRLAGTTRPAGPGRPVPLSSGYEACHMVAANSMRSGGSQMRSGPPPTNRVISGRTTLP